MTILFDTLMPVIRKADTRNRCFRHVTGEWHVTCFVPMPEGPSHLEWEMPPDQLDLFAAFVEQGEATMGMLTTYLNAIARVTTTIVLEPTGGP